MEENKKIVLANIEKFWTGVKWTETYTDAMLFTYDGALFEIYQNELSHIWMIEDYGLETERVLHYIHS